MRTCHPVILNKRKFDDDDDENDDDDLLMIIINIRVDKALGILALYMYYSRYLVQSLPIANAALGLHHSSKDCLEMQSKSSVFVQHNKITGNFLN